MKKLGLLLFVSLAANAKSIGEISSCAVNNYALAQAALPGNDAAFNTDKGLRLRALLVLGEQPSGVKTLIDACPSVLTAPTSCYQADETRACLAKYRRDFLDLKAACSAANTAAAATGADEPCDISNYDSYLELLNGEAKDTGGYFNCFTGIDSCTDSNSVTDDNGTTGSDTGTGGGGGLTTANPTVPADTTGAASGNLYGLSGSRPASSGVTLPLAHSPLSFSGDKRVRAAGRFTVTAASSDKTSTSASGRGFGVAAKTPGDTSCASSFSGNDPASFKTPEGKKAYPGFKGIKTLHIASLEYLNLNYGLLRLAESERLITKPEGGLYPHFLIEEQRTKTRVKVNVMCGDYKKVRIFGTSAPKLVKAVEGGSADEFVAVTGNVIECSSPNTPVSAILEILGPQSSSVAQELNLFGIAETDSGLEDLQCSSRAFVTRNKADYKKRLEDVMSALGIVKLPEVLDDEGN